MNPSAITSERWFEFAALVIQVRALQKDYRRTVDSRIRRRMETAEAYLDAVAIGILADLDVKRQDLDQVGDLVAAAIAAEPAIVEEGGAT